ncbi:MAG: hypothetical protein JXA42_10595 [Anaerolineales bacterium]|nr:hypothetical protein [Anaerolineales bacterium]
MNQTNKIPEKPMGIINSVSAGLDSVIQGWWIILFPLVLDIFLWFGRRLSIKPVIERIVSELTQVAGNTPLFDLFLEAASELNYFSLVSVSPLGIPSLMSLKMPQSSPLGIPSTIQIENELTWLGLFALLSLIGLFLGGIYLGLIAQQVRDGNLNPRRLFGILPRYYGSLLVLVITLIIVSGIIIVPVMVLATIFAGFSAWLATLVLWLGFMIISWMLFHLAFSIHGILLSEESLVPAVWNSLRLTAVNSFPTMGLFLLISALSAGLDYLWNLPKEDSWMLLIGIAGHALISSGLAAATFIFYQDRYRYWKEMRSYLSNAMTAEQ